VGAFYCPQDKATGVSNPALRAVNGRMEHRMEYDNAESIDKLPA
jgi:hypothetical protein